MKEKKIIPLIDLDSFEFRKKILVAINEADGVNTNLITLPDKSRQEEMDNFLFLVMNTKSSKRKYCKACGAYHWIFMKDFEQELEDRGCLCSRCASILTLLVYFKRDKDKVLDWIKSEGKINPFEMIRDGIEDFVKKGTIKVTETQTS